MTTSEKLQLSVRLCIFYQPVSKGYYLVWRQPCPWSKPWITSNVIDLPSEVTSLHFPLHWWLISSVCPTTGESWTFTSIAAQDRRTKDPGPWVCSATLVLTDVVLILHPKTQVGKAVWLANTYVLLCSWINHCRHQICTWCVTVTAFLPRLSDVVLSGSDCDTDEHELVLYINLRQDFCPPWNGTKP